MNVENAVQELKDDVLDFAKDLFGDSVSEAKEITDKFIDETKGKLKEWSIALIKRDLDKGELTYLLNSRKDSLILLALGIAGSNEIKANKLAVGVIDLIIKKVEEA